VTWDPGPSSLTLIDNEVHLWLANLDESLDLRETFAALLSEDELERAWRFRFQRDRDYLIVRRALLRILLARYLRTSPSAIYLTYTDEGKPQLGPPLCKAGLHFSVSHSRGIAMYALTQGRAVGVDIEAVRPVPEAEQVAHVSFSPTEGDAFRALPPDEALTGFFNCWTAKEAIVKALGKGLSFPLDGFTVSLEPSEPASLLSTDNDLRLAAGWSLRRVEPAPGRIATVAVDGEISALRCWYLCPPR
jgi:4'-phosphopantetheinyl transferase